MTMRPATRRASPPPGATPASTASERSAAWRAAIRRACRDSLPRMRAPRLFDQLVAVVEQESLDLGLDAGERGDDVLRFLAGDQDRRGLHDVGIVAEEIAVFPQVDEGGAPGRNRFGGGLGRRRVGGG